MVELNSFSFFTKDISFILDNQKSIENWILLSISIEDKSVGEITYIFCEAYPAGELKHGTISQIEKGTLVICFITQKDISEKTLNAIYEVKSRGAQILLLLYPSGSKLFPETIQYFSGIISSALLPCRPHGGADLSSLMIDGPGTGLERGFVNCRNRGHKGAPVRVFGASNDRVTKR